MQSAAQAYGKVATQTVAPRDLEANLLLKAAARLQAIHDEWEQKRAELDTALIYNRKLWTIFLAAVTKSDHPLPAPIRQNVANLGLFVMNQTIDLTAAPAREKLPTLININRELAAGLMGRG
jgi:flagellar protein FlaF